MKSVGSDFVDRNSCRIRSMGTERERRGGKCRIVVIYQTKSARGVGNIAPNEKSFDFYSHTCEAWWW